MAYGAAGCDALTTVLQVQTVQPRTIRLLSQLSLPWSACVMEAATIPTSHQRQHAGS